MMATKGQARRTPESLMSVQISIIHLISVWTSVDWTKQHCHQQIKGKRPLLFECAFHVQRCPIMQRMKEMEMEKQKTNSDETWT